MSGQHTPGPWRVEVRPTIVMVLHDARGKGDGYNNRVAECHHWSPASGPQTSPMEAEANARLIAAAPELLAALERGVTLYERELLHLVPSKDAEAFLRIARAAISKARGGAA